MARSQVTRDRIMDAYHKLHPQYDFDKHKARMPSRQCLRQALQFCILVRCGQEASGRLSCGLCCRAMAQLPTCWQSGRMGPPHVLCTHEAHEEHLRPAEMLHWLLLVTSSAVSHKHAHMALRLTTRSSCNQQHAAQPTCPTGYT